MRAASWGVSLAACMWLATVANARAQALHDGLTLRLSDQRQAQFAGYYVALAKGFYDAAGLDVRIRPGPADGDATPPAAGEAGLTVWSAWLPQALWARAHGLALVNIAQIFLHSGLALVCRKASGIHSPADLAGKTIGVWQDGAEIPFLAWMRRLGFTVPAQVRMLPTRRAPREASIDPLLNRDAACITVLNYDQYGQLIAEGLKPEDLVVFHYGDFGTALLQDGLYATDAALADPLERRVLVRFLRASLRGWQYAAAHQAEAVRIVAGEASASDAQRQGRMMSVVARLIGSGLQPAGYLEPAAFDRTVGLLVRAGVIGRAPVGAWTHGVWAEATGK